MKNIEGLIKGEYEIDRNEFLEKITKDNERYISIQGGAGSGKSVLCKKYVENEKLVLYARAERFLEESHIDDIHRYILIQWFRINAMEFLIIYIQL